MNCKGFRIFGRWRGRFRRGCRGDLKVRASEYSSGPNPGRFPNSAEEVDILRFAQDDKALLWEKSR
jgi:hypothetical protein